MGTSFLTAARKSAVVENEGVGEADDSAGVSVATAVSVVVAVAVFVLVTVEAGDFAVPSPFVQETSAISTPAHIAMMNGTRAALIESPLLQALTNDLRMVYDSLAVNHSCRTDAFWRIAAALLWRGHYYAKPFRQGSC
ncbi:hypothetical protein OOK12_02440 [Streptomyces sp. NBC_00452]|uniref:hypothetical protein n=1 Tax=Streptomyces sp. NBC_00452 TaxID=2975746 RepID=UPI0022509090|nr:hypothetical protein [Streptomyces sp. NBC_00452]MCX5055925.1 hypothetical protein [Streptomyces sp. NBC_00452]